MDAENKRVFPLSRQFYGDTKFYYAFGNSPPEDFLQSVSLADCCEPTILSLGCGDMRSSMFTILNNFGLEGEFSDGFRGVHFVLNDRSASVLARNILFLYLCMLLPGSGVERKRWIASMWSIWYNHELQPQHNDMLLSALEELCRWSVSWQEWSKCPLGQLVKFSSPATFAAVKKVWCKWQSFTMSVEEMKSKRNHLLLHQIRKQGCKSKEEGLKKYQQSNILLNRVCFLYSSEIFSTIQKEYLEYLTQGFVWAETVLGVPMASPKTVVNPTLFEHAEGTYTLHYELTPYMGFKLNFLYTCAELGKTLGRSSSLLKLLPVSDKRFRLKPLLANCVQQFSMWLQATANVIKNPSNTSVSFSFIIEDSISLCFSWSKILYFDAIYTSNLLDHVSPPALVLNALPLLKPTGTLFTETYFGKLYPNYLELNFGFSPEVFPALLGVHCIGQDGQYSPAVNHDLDPNILHSTQLTYSTSYVWRNVEASQLNCESIEESALAIKSLLKLCQITFPFFGVQVNGSAESFLCVLHRFLKQVQFQTPIHQFLQPLCDAIRSEAYLKPHLIQLQTQSLLHDIHMHLTVTDDDCPICKGQPLESYIQQFTLSLDIDSLHNVEPHNPPTFDLHFTSLSGDYSIVKSFSISCSELKLDLTFFLPKHCISHYSFLRVEMHQHLVQKNVYCGPVQNLQCSPAYDYVFMKTSSKLSDLCPLGHIKKHIGDGHKFETVISMSDACVTMLKKSKLSANYLKQNQLQLCCGQLKFTISYPYAIEDSKTHIKISKMKKVISVVVQHKASPLLNENLTHFIDTRNGVTHPNFHCGTEVMEVYCSLQSPCNKPGHPLYSAKQSFTELFKNALNGQKIFTFSFPSRRFANSPDVYALMYVHNLRFSTVFSSPVLDVSYCFLDTKPQHLLRDFNRLANRLLASLGPSVDVMVDDAEYKFQKDILRYFSSITRTPFPSNLNKVTKEIEEHKLWEHFDHAILFPLYPNPANSAYQKFTTFISQINITEGLWQHENQPFNMQVLSMGRSDVCSFCQTSAVALKCEQCQRASYCSNECLEMHWKFHNTVCNKAKKNESVISLEQTADSTANPAVLAGTCASQEYSPSSAESHEPKNEVKCCSPTMCARCKKPAKIICQCQQVFYCSKACQTLEQPEHSEKCQQVSRSDKGTLTQSREYSTQHSTATTVGADCARCKKPAAILCQCQQVSYCSKECQTLELPGHSEKCQHHMSSGKVPPSTKTEVPSGESKAHSAQHPSGIECVRCKKPAVIVCQCKQVSYCSEICQNLEWPVHGETCVRTSQDPPQSQSYSTPERSKRATECENPKTVSMAQKCYNCGKTKSSLKHCKCRNVSYCSVECQRLHWPQHKPTCTAIRK